LQQPTPKQNEPLDGETRRTPTAVASGSRLKAATSLSPEESFGAPSVHRLRVAPRLRQAGAYRVAFELGSSSV
jgi:hypothetical protein